jgi:hypothetical protein
VHRPNGLGRHALAHRVQVRLRPWRRCILSSLRLC